jgi:crotonobetainyl-CoA:carnitine CoA-transferase CaiB-like acyl-CoA transferase
VWPGPLDVSGLAVAGVREAACAAASLAHRRGASPGFTVDSRAVAAALASLDRLRVDGRALQAWAGLSGFFPTGDGWVRLHANYPHHRRALLSALSVGAEDDETAAGLVRRALADMTAVEAEDQVRAAGGVAAAVRTAESWRQHPQGSAVLGEPLVAIETTGVPGAALGRTGELPLSGLRVLDLTRVIAGPVATRTLGALGAEVLRIDPPHRPELLEQHLDTGFAKRSALADLRRPGQRERVEELVSAADVVITGYRPAALAGFGLGAEQLLQRHPGLVVGELAAWGFTGPWSRERGFDSIVQAASGIAHRYRKRDGRPGALPVQALDHSAGYLLAAAVMRLLARRPETGGGVVRVSLARVARELLGMAAPEPGAEEPEPWPLRTCECPHGELAYVPPPFLLDGEQLDYSSPPSRYGQDDLVWRSAR